MRIAIDTQTTLGEKTGFGFYVKNLVEYLIRIDPGNTYILIKPNTRKDLSTPKRFIWDQFVVPKRARENGVDLLHQPCFSAPIFYPGKVVVTVHDLISIFFPKNLPAASRFFYSRWMPFSYRTADMFITISRHTKKDMISLLRIPEEKIRVIYEGCGSEFRPIRNRKVLEQVRKKYDLRGKFLLHVGTIEPRKNLEFLVRAFHRMIRHSRIPYTLVITGKKGWYYDGLFRLVSSLRLRSRVFFTGYVDDNDMPALYNIATALVFPSLYEGFGLTPLEAMASGCPVISSNTSSMPEVTGKAGILLSPHDLDGWADAMANVGQNKGTREHLRWKGLQQAKKFSWEETARQTLAVYEEVILAR